MKGKIETPPARDLNGKWHLTLTVDDSVRGVWDKYQGKKLSIEIKQYKEKRSLDANAYAWHLIGEIADILRTDKDSIYLKMLKRYGQGGVAKIRNEQVENFQRAWKYNEPHESLTQGKNAQYFRFWVGSSNYNTKEMSVFIDGIVSEARDLGIETMTPAELASIKGAWQ